MLDIVRIGDVWRSIAIWALGNRLLVFSQLSCIYEQCCAIGKDVEAALATTCVDKVDVKIALTPCWKGLAMLGADGITIIAAARGAEQCNN